jgi:hypothetical protein
MQKPAVFMHQAGHFRDRLHDTSLVVGRLHRDQRPTYPLTTQRLQPTRQGNKIHLPLRRGRDLLHLIRSEPAAGAYRSVLDRGYQQPLPGRRPITFRIDCRRERQRIGLGSARGEHHVPGRSPEQGGYLLAGLLDQTTRGATLGMH